MANLHRGLKRIIWILSVMAALITWIGVLSKTDLSPQKITDERAITFVNWLDHHFFTDQGPMDPKGWLMIEKYRKDKIFKNFENAITSNHSCEWPYMAQLDKVKGFNADQYIWGSKLNSIVDSMKYEIIRAFPSLDFKSLSERYNPVNGGNFGFAKYRIPVSYSYHRPIGRIIFVVFSGFIPFIAIWAIWFLINWVIQGFKS